MATVYPGAGGLSTRRAAPPAEGKAPPAALVFCFAKGGKGASALGGPLLGKLPGEHGGAQGPHGLGVAQDLDGLF